MVTRDQRIREWRERVREVWVTHSNSLILSPSIISKARSNPSITPPLSLCVCLARVTSQLIISVILIPSLPDLITDYLHW